MQRVPELRQVSLLIGLLACRGPAPAATRPTLPAAYGEYLKADNVLLFELPDSGGYLANGVPVDTAQVLSLLHTAYDRRQPQHRATFLRDNPNRPWQDVEFIVAKAAAAGVQVFDAAASGALSPDQIITVDPDTIP